MFGKQTSEKSKQQSGESIINNTVEQPRNIKLKSLS